MILAVVSCWKYRDCWKPFFALLDTFWPDHPEAVLLTDDYDMAPDVPARVRIVSGPRSPRWSWCQVVANFADMMIDRPDETILLMQDDFFINAPVKADIIQHGLDEMGRLKASAVRLYPCPGADVDYGDLYYGEVSQNAPYRISCQATIWSPEFLMRIARHAAGSAAAFEIEGNRSTWNETVLALKRDAKPWPLQYLCSGIARGRWNPDAKRLFESQGIEADYSLREMAAA